MPTMTLRIYYSGRVQGVGFRYTVREIAKHNPIDGYVRNLPDGRVELLVQGTLNQIERVTQAIAERFRGNIDGVDRQELADREDLQGFQIRH